VPTEKRARQRAGRQARLEALAQHQRRRRQVRTSVIVLVIAAVVVGSVYLITRPKPKPTATFPDTPQGRLEHIWVTNGCPESITTRVNNQQYSTVPPNTLNASATYEATVRTDVGSFVISMNPKVSPIAVNSFVFLANRGFFSCVIFHRVIQGFVNQTGDPTGTGTGGPGYQFTEAGPAKATPQYPIGSVVLANSDNPGTTMPKTNGSQWFVVTGAQGEALPPYYVLFGQVTSGMSVLQTINSNGAPASSQAGKPTVTHRILTVKIKEVPSS
jgi:cyclophilin family peptidyl-prolyl cis-trans isomerase